MKNVVNNINVLDAKIEEEREKLATAALTVVFLERNLREGLAISPRHTKQVLVEAKIDLKKQLKRFDILNDARILIERNEVVR